jgi:hypothetical protein
MSVVDPVNPAPVEPQDPYANKAVVAAVTTLTRGSFTSKSLR